MNDPIVLLWHWLAVGQPGAPLVPTWLTVTVALATAGMLLEALLLLAWHRRTGRGLRTVARMEALHPVDPEHWYLAVLGTDPAHQGQGVGGALVKAAPRTRSIGSSETGPPVAPCEPK